MKRHMAYGLTISRGFPWAKDGKHSSIDLDEWNSLIAESSELKAMSEVRGRNPKTGEEIVIQTPNSATLQPGLQLSWRGGYITAEHVDANFPSDC